MSAVRRFRHRFHWLFLPPHGLLWDGLTSRACGHCRPHVPGLRQNAAQRRWTVKPILCLKTCPYPGNGGNFVNKQMQRQARFPV
jgi:hypothetical protein